MDLQYWQTRYKDLGGARTVGHKGWKPEEYEAANKYIRSVIGNLIYNCGGNILDYGCGIGRFTEFIVHRNGGKYTGLDIVPEVIEQNKLTMPRHEWSLIKDYRWAAKFSLIFSAFVLQHIVEDAEVVEAVTHWGKTLQDGGSVIVITATDTSSKDLNYLKYRNDAWYTKAFKDAGLNVIHRQVDKLHAGIDHTIYVLTK